MDQTKKSDDKEVNVLRDKNGIPILGTSDEATEKINKLARAVAGAQIALQKAHNQIVNLSQNEANLVALVFCLLEDKENSRVRVSLDLANEYKKKFVHGEIALQTYVDKQTNHVVAYTEEKKKEDNEEKKESPIITP